MKAVRSRSEKISFAIALGFHIVLALLLVISFNKTIKITAPPSDGNKPIIDAVMISKKSLQEEVARIEEKETKKREQEQNRIKEIAQKEKEAKQKREKEESLAIELKKKNEELKKEAEIKKLAEEKREVERQVKLKQEQEELKKIQKEKEEALALKKKAEIERKVAEEKQKKEQELAEKKIQELAKESAPAPQVTSRAKQDQITRHALLIQSKINQHWRKPIGFDFDGFKCVIDVKLLPTGDVVEAVVIESSGSLEFDRSAEVAVRKASPLPMPEDTSVAKEFRQFTFLFREVV